MEAEALAAEALKKIGDHRVDDVVVRESDGCPVGLIDITDVVTLLPADDTQQESPKSKQPATPEHSTGPTVPATVPFTAVHQTT